MALGLSTTPGAIGHLIEALERLLSAYPGALLLVSYDASLAEAATGITWSVREMESSYALTVSYRKLEIQPTGMPADQPLTRGNWLPVSTLWRDEGSQHRAYCL